jgi:predicted acyl esterase
MLIQPWHPDTRASQQPVEADKVYRLDVEIFPTFAVVAAGHTLRLAIQTVDEPHLSPAAPQLADSAGGVVTLYTGPRYRSALVVGLQR